MEQVFPLRVQSKRYGQSMAENHPLGYEVLGSGKKREIHIFLKLVNRSTIYHECVCISGRGHG